MNARRAIVALACAALAAVACQSAPPPTAGQGTVAGKVRAKPRHGVDTAASGYPGGKKGRERVDYGSLEGIVVWLEGADAGSPPGAATTLTSKGFEPGTVALGTGGELEVKNATASAATLFAEGTIDEVTIAAGALARIKVTRPGPALAVVAELEEPKLRLLVASTSRLAVLSSGDSFSFAAPAPGDYTLKAWHWRLPACERRVRLESGKAVEQDLDLSVDELGKR